MMTRLDHIQLAMPIGGEDKARAFWQDLLGMKEEVKPEPLASRGGCWFRTDSVILHLGVEKNFAPQKKGHPAFCAEDLDALAVRLNTGGCPVIWDEALPTRRRFYSEDPFGNRIEFIPIGFNTPELAPAWMDVKVRNGEPVYPQAAQCISADVSLGVFVKVSEGGDE